MAYKVCYIRNCVIHVLLSRFLWDSVNEDPTYLVRGDRLCYAMPIRGHIELLWLFLWVDSSWFEDWDPPQLYKEVHLLRYN